MRVAKNKTSVLLFIITALRPSDSDIKGIIDVKVNF